MDLEKLQQEAEALKQINTAQLSPEQLEEFLTKAMNLLEQTQQSLLNTSLIEINKNENNESDD
jgi:phage terminase large subunit-like protein